MNENTVTVGRIVHYTDPALARGECRPAIVVRVWGDNGVCNLTVFPDWSNEGKEGSFWATSVQFRDSFPDGEAVQKRQAVWHWPERA